MSTMIEIIESASQEAVIKVIGVGGCGGNAVDHMINNGIGGVELVAVKTDAQALKRSLASTTIQIGQEVTRGLGAGANPEKGYESAVEDQARLAEAIAGADMLFITAGMGGGTGTGAAPFIAQIAKDMGILTVAVVTKPFDFEGAKRAKAAQAGIEKLRQHVDSLIVIPNDRLLEVLGDDVGYDEAFKASNDVLNGAVSGIAEIINCPGLVNVDFADVRTVMRENGMAMMGSAYAEGAERAQRAAESAIHSPLLEDIHLSGARGVLVNITGPRNMKLKEIKEAMGTIKSVCAEDATIIFGSVFDDNMTDGIRVTVVATGLGGGQAQRRPEIVVNNTQMVASGLRTGTHDGNGYHPQAQAFAPGVGSGALSSSMGSVGTTEGWSDFETPSAVRSRRGPGVSTGVTSHGDLQSVDSFSRRNVDIDALDIPAFIRKQAD